jgi:DNA helicase-2/ATP-dependent DNA helicase PcrA
LNSSIDYRKLLNSAQLQAVMTLEGPVLVIAGAGSGKTRTLVYRVARLVEAGVAPESILLLTFTRKAAQEMLNRAARLSDARCRLVSGGTFHSLAHRVLRSHAEHISFSRSFAILDRSDMEEIILSLVPDLRMPKGVRFPKKSTLANIMSKAANLQKPLQDFMLEEYGQFVEYIPQIAELAGLYAEYKISHQMMDYDDLLLNFQKLLAENESVRQGLSRQYSHIMVDEYQDTNSIQADIVRWLALEHRNIMVVGDDSQSIYSFRGANYRNMFDFTRHFPEAEVIKLEQNYRSTQPILSFTNALVDQANEKYTKCLFTRRQGGDPPRVINTRTEPEQALFVCRQVMEQVRQGRTLDHLAVLFRAAYHSFELEAELTRNRIGYAKYGGFKFLESAHIKDFLAYLRVVVHRDDTVSWVRLLRLVKNIGQRRSRAIIDWMKANRVAPHEVGDWPGAGKNDGGLHALSKLLISLQPKQETPEQAVREVLDYYLPHLKERFDDYPRRQREVEQLLPMAARYKSLRSFLDDLILEPPASSEDLRREQKGEHLTLSTVHSAKGLEWPVVYVIWAMEGRFPIARSYNDPMALEEERRLMYVAATRAREQLIFCYPAAEAMPSWSTYGAGGAGYRSGLSSFIDSLPAEVFLHESTGAAAGVRRAEAAKLFPAAEQAPSPEESLAPGDRVKHPAFGSGVISKFVEEDKVEVFFRSFGPKLLHLHHTTLRKI